MVTRHTTSQSESPPPCAPAVVGPTHSETHSETHVEQPVARELEQPQEPDAPSPPTAAAWETQKSASRWSNHFARHGVNGRVEWEAVLDFPSGWYVAPLYPKAKQRADKIWRDAAGNIFRSRKQAQLSLGGGGQLSLAPDALQTTEEKQPDKQQTKAAEEPPPVQHHPSRSSSRHTSAVTKQLQSQFPEADELLLTQVLNSSGGNQQAAMHSLTELLGPPVLPPPSPPAAAPTAKERKGKAAGKAAGVKAAEFTVECIAAERVTGGKTEYWVKWDGYDTSENTWEPGKNLDTAALMAWQASVEAEEQAEEPVDYECENCCGFESTCIAFVEDHETRCTFGRGSSKRLRGDEEEQQNEEQDPVTKLRKRFNISASAATACFEAGAASATGALPAVALSSEQLREAAIQAAAIKVFRRNARAFCCDQIGIDTVCRDLEQTIRCLT